MAAGQDAPAGQAEGEPAGYGLDFRQLGHAAIVAQIFLDLTGGLFYTCSPMNALALVYFLAGWAVPGLGHLLQKKYLRGLVFLVCLGAMTALGLVMGGRIFPFQLENPLTILAFFADIGNGLVYLLSRFLPIGLGTLKNVTYEFGTAYLAGAGLLNFLVALDAYDIAAGKKK